MKFTMLVRSLIIIMCLLLSSCKAKQVLVQSAKSNTFRITEQYRDTTIIVPGDSIHIQLPILVADSIVKPISYIARGNKSSVRVNVSSNGKLDVTTICDQYEAKVKLLEHTIERYEHEASVYKEKETAFQAAIHKMQSSFKTLATLAFIVMLLFAVLKFKTFLFNNYKNQ